MGRPPLYNWDSWLDGDVHTLTHVEYGPDPLKEFEFDSDPRTMRSLIYRTAKSREQRVALFWDGAGHIVVQTYPHGQRAPRLGYKDLTLAAVPVPEDVKRCRVCDEPLPMSYSPDFDECQIVNLTTWKTEGNLHT
jgi:hypothetical protein